MHSDLSTTPLQWSIFRHPRTAKGRSGTPEENIDKWDKEAASPGAVEIRIRFDDSRLLAELMKKWGYIGVTRDGIQEITVQQVLEAIYAYFQQTITVQEFYELSTMDRNLIFASRYRLVDICSSDAPPSQLPLRVDVLNGWTDFAQLKLVAAQDGHVELSLALGLSVAWHVWPYDDGGNDNAAKQSTTL
jgi:hypothetical protein